MPKSKKKYPKQSAGALMRVDVPVCRTGDTISDIEEMLLSDIKKFVSINYIYVVGERKRLKGVISIKELFRQKKSKKAASIMVKKPVTADALTDQEAAAYLALQKNIKAVPVVSRGGKFLGVVMSDDILGIVYREMHEDISRFAGVDNSAYGIDDISKMSLWASLKHRLPWLVVGILGGLVAAQVIGLFEYTLEKNIILAAFIPLIVYIASAVGTQAGFFVVRDLALNKALDFRDYALRQLNVIFTMGIVISLIIFGVVYLVYSELAIALTLAVAVLLTVMSAVITGIFIPYLFSRLKLDPANASGPVATIIQDLISVSIYLTVARILL